MIIYMPVSLFGHRPEQCPFGHSVAPGMPQRVGWMPCICAPACEASERGRGMGHLWISCDTCHRNTGRPCSTSRSTSRGVADTFQAPRDVW
jgi:hypothetical protein